MWNSRLGCLMPGRMPSPQIMDLIKSSFLSQFLEGLLIIPKALLTLAADL
jgi:hypothetical protein